MEFLARILAATLVFCVLAPAPGQAAEPLALEDIAGQTWSAEQLRGKVVLLDFWATWCLPCIAEFPTLRQLDERFADDDFVLLGIALDAIDRRGLRSFLRRHHVEWSQVHDRRGVEGELARRYGVEAVPSTVLIDREGRVVARDLRGRALEVSVEALIR